jgi:hypothetical protein
VSAPVRLRPDTLNGHRRSKKPERSRVTSTSIDILEARSWSFRWPWAVQWRRVRTGHIARYCMMFEPTRCSYRWGEVVEKTGTMVRRAHKAVDSKGQVGRWPYEADLVEVLSCTEQYHLSARRSVGDRAGQAFGELLGSPRFSLRPPPRRGLGATKRKAGSNAKPEPCVSPALMLLLSYD